MLQARQMLEHLQDNNWLDYYTRAIFMEFTVYNPNTNLFSYVNYVMEFPPMGSVIPFPRVMTFMVYPGTGAMGKVNFTGFFFKVISRLMKPYAEA